MLGIIGAMDTEVDRLKSALENPQTTTLAGLDFVCGSIGGTPLCVVRCSPGKVNAALCTQLLIDRFSPEAVVNLGVGCSLSETVGITDVVIADAVCQYDFDTSAIDGVKGLVIDGRITLPADRALSDMLEEAAAHSGRRVHRGCIASGDTFIASAQLKQQIAADFGAICGEMEGGAVGQVCYVNRVPFAVLRTVSDGGDEAAQMDYPAFKEAAAAISVQILLRCIKKAP